MEEELGFGVAMADMKKGINSKHYGVSTGIQFCPIKLDFRDSMVKIQLDRFTKQINTLPHISCRMVKILMSSFYIEGNASI